MMINTLLLLRAFVLYCHVWFSCFIFCLIVFGSHLVTLTFSVVNNFVIIIIILIIYYRSDFVGLCSVMLLTLCWIQIHCIHIVVSSTTHRQSSCVKNSSSTCQLSSTCYSRCTNPTAAGAVQGKGTWIWQTVQLVYLWFFLDLFIFWLVDF